MPFCDDAIPMRDFRAKNLWLWSSHAQISTTSAQAVFFDEVTSPGKVHNVPKRRAVRRLHVLRIPAAQDMSFQLQELLPAGFFVALCLLCGSLTLIDIRRGIIPDAHNLAIACLGLTRAVVTDGVLAGLEAAAEAIAVGIIFWLFRRFYFVVRKIQGLGLGDVKFLAAATPWVGIAGVPMLLLVAALSALIAIGGMRIAGQKLTRETSLPFGPFLAIGLLSAVTAQQWLGLG